MEISKKAPFVRESRRRRRENSLGERPGVRELGRICEIWRGWPVRVSSSSRCRSDACVVNFREVLDIGGELEVVRERAVELRTVWERNSSAHGPWWKEP